MRIFKTIALLMMAFAIVACEGGREDDGSNKPNYPGQIPDEGINDNPSNPNHGKEDGDNEENGNEGNGNEGNGNKEDGGEEVLDATYIFKDNLLGILRVVDGALRNDYVEFLDNTTGHALYIDFYSPLGGEYLPTGTYPLGDGSSMTSDKKYTYILLSGWSDFIYITEGSAEVVAERDEVTGDIIHTVTADYTMSTGDTIALRYNGTFEIREM